MRIRMDSPRVCTFEWMRRLRATKSRTTDHRALAPCGGSLSACKNCHSWKSNALLTNHWMCSTAHIVNFSREGASSFTTTSMVMQLSRWKPSRTGCDFRSTLTEKLVGGINWSPAGAVTCCLRLRFIICKKRSCVRPLKTPSACERVESYRSQLMIILAASGISWYKDKPFTSTDSARSSSLLESVALSADVDTALLMGVMSHQFMTSPKTASAPLLWSR
mmetsp:Transcript_124761/g.347405  ORF Transcript_124761/g.347405 Transcript_124761/m.347405 type:complete len:220 (+) Transcript_124761:975-1634(+)